MYPFPGIGGATYLGNGTYTRQPQQPQQPTPQTPMQGGGLLSPQPQTGIPYASFNSAPGSGMAQMQSIQQQFGQPSSYSQASGNPYAQNSMMGGQYQGGGMNSAMGNPYGGFGANPYAQNSFSGYGQTAGNPYAQNYGGGMNSMMGGGFGYGQNIGAGQYQGSAMNSTMGAQGGTNPYAAMQNLQAMGPGPSNPMPPIFGAAGGS